MLNKIRLVFLCLLSFQLSFAGRPGGFTVPIQRYPPIYYPAISENNSGSINDGFNGISSNIREITEEVNNYFHRKKKKERIWNDK